MTAFTSSAGASTRRGARSVSRILEAAARLFGAEGFESASMSAVARAAGVSKGLLHYHFRSKEHLLIEAQRSTFKKIHLEFEARFAQGERGLETALEAIDALWEALCGMRTWAPFMVEVMSLAGQNRPIRPHVDEFYNEATVLLERGVRNVFAQDLDVLVMPPERLAMVIRTALHGLVVELSLARTPSQVAKVDQSYRDLHSLFARSVLSGPFPPEVIP
ncbi:MAG: helix-turn-helix domain-containing protein [Myxococcota bacterium]|nr:helix-turn-helix domain-containing protein [Myxococcota bacterium]